MHVLIGLLTAVGGLVWALVALQRAGFELGALDLLAWRRRAQWRRRYAARPLYNLAAPMEIAALLLLAVLKCEGEVDADQKRALLDIFREEFHLGQDEAADLLLACSHLLRDEIYLVDHLEQVLARGRQRFSTEQIASVLGLMERVATLEGPANAEQRKLIDATHRLLPPPGGPRSRWA